MTPYHVALDVAYVVTALCVCYKMAYLVGQLSLSKSTAASWLRWMAAITGTFVVVTAVISFKGVATATVGDSIRNLSWCAFLVTVIMVVKNKTGFW